MSLPATRRAAIAKLIADLQSDDDAVRGAAWQGAAPLGAMAVQPLAEVAGHPDFEVARAARRALWKIVRHAGRPEAAQERRAVQAELLSVLRRAPTPVRREALWMLSEIGDTRAVSPIAALLTDGDVCEAARCALERIPGDKAVRALEKALRTAPDAFRPALAHSLRVRGRNVEDWPSRKLAPVKPTGVRGK